MFRRSWAITTFGTTCAVFVGACSDTSGPSRLGSIPPPQPLNCSIPVGAIADGGPGKDGIPALVNPSLVINGDSEIGYLQDSDRVIGVAWSGEAVAVPLNVGWWHEIVNLEIDGLPVAITHCPLTGSSLAFDRDPADGATFGVSGLLYQNNLIMYDRNDAESLWPQMSRGARCGTRDGTALRMLPVIEMTWEGWRTLHPNTKVVAGVSGRGYHRNTYPYSNGTYDQVGNNVLLFDMPGGVDTRRPIKERVLGVPDGSGGMAFPFGALDEVGPAAAVRGTLADGSRYVVFWDRRHQAAMAYRPSAAGQDLNFEVQDGEITDIETGSTWSVDGWSGSGELAGEHLEPIAEAYTAFWFAWAAFQPDTQLYREGAT